MPENQSGCSEPIVYRLRDPEEEAFWREHLKRLHDPAKIEALCKREYEETHERYQRGLADGSYSEADRDLIVGTLDSVRRWWAGELLKMEGITAVERRWSSTVLAERWF